MINNLKIGIELHKMEENERIAYLRFLNLEKPSASTGIDGGLTLGYGKLDNNGYWEFPLPRNCWTKEQLEDI